MSGHNRSETYLRFERIPPRPQETPRAATAAQPARRDDSPQPKYKNAGRETNPIASCRLDDAGSTERNLLREILGAVKVKESK